MSVGNLKTQGDKGSNFTYQFRSLRLLLSINNQLAAQNMTPVISGVSADGLLATVPAGYMLEMIVAQPIGGVADITLDVGTTNAGSELLPGGTIVMAQANSFQFNHAAPGNVAFDVYVSSPDWGLGTVTFYLILRKVS
jgi:hypothetical protein